MNHTTGVKAYVGYGVLLTAKLTSYAPPGLDLGGPYITL
jgi:hypothetical protein